MGCASYDCAHCGHPLLDPDWTTRFVNEWMSQGVLLLANGSRILGVMDDEGHALGDFQWGEHTGERMVFAHQACWKQAGKPEFEEYARPSRPSNQNKLKPEGYDIPEPGGEVNQTLWDASIRLREERTRRRRIERVAEFLRHPKNPPRYQVQLIEAHKGPGQDWWPDRVVGWSVGDYCGISGLSKEEAVYGIASEEEAQALADRLNREWLEGEAAEMMAEFRTWQQHYFDKWAAKLRDSGERFKVTDSGRNEGYRVQDQDDYTRRSELFPTVEAATAAAQELNEEWVANGMPIDKHTPAEWDYPEGFVRCRLGYDDPDVLPIFAAEDEEMKQRTRHLGSYDEDDE